MLLYNKDRILLRCIMAEVIKIVLTGGPCAGKSTAVKYVSQQLDMYNIKNIVIDEQATKLFLSGKSPKNMGNYEFHKLLFKEQLDNEKRQTEFASKFPNEKVVLICDRGLLDSRAYVTQEEFDRYSSLYGTNEDILRNSYDAVFHLVTAAKGAKEHYAFDSNIVRSENVDEAIRLDDDILSIWTGTPHLRVVDNSTDFDNKLARLMTEILGFLGEPEPLEIERKFLIEYPELDEINKIKVCRKVPIMQAYLTTPQNGNFRIRRRGEGDRAVYIKTVKIKINDIKRIEIENYISKEEFYKYLAQQECVTGIISKDRYCIVYNNTYYELDIYPFWNDRATLEIELLSENQPYDFPPFAKLIREVSFEPEYRNLALAQKYGYEYYNKDKNKTL